MGELIIIDPKKLDVDFEDITAFKIIDFLFSSGPDRGWQWSSTENLHRDSRVEFVELTDKIQPLIILDFEKEEIRLVEFEVTVKETVKKTTTVSIKKVKPAV